MTFNVSIDWKLAAAFGLSVVGILFVSKLDSASLERISTQAVLAYWDHTVATVDDSE